MSAEAHKDFAHEFPELKDAIRAKKGTDNHFKRLFEEYEDIAKEIYRDGTQLSDEHAEELKKRRLQLKDELYQMLTSCGKKTCGCG